MAAAGAEVGQPQVGQGAKALDLVPQPGLGAGVEHVQLEPTQPVEGGSAAQFVDDGEGGDLPQRHLGPGALERQVGLTVADFQPVVGQAEVREPGQEIRREDRLDAVEGVAGQPDLFALAEADGAGVVQLLAQGADVDLVGQADGAGAVDDLELHAHVAVFAPDQLKHQQLVEVGVQQAAYDRIEPPGVVVGAAGEIGHRAGFSLGEVTTRPATTASAPKRARRASIAVSVFRARVSGVANRPAGASSAS